MCTPLAATAAQIGFSALTTGVTYASQKEKAEAQTEYNQKVIDANAESANDAYRSNTQQEQTRTINEETGMSNDMQNLQEERLRAEGQAIASSNGAGVNTDYLLQDYRRQTDRHVSALRQQWDWKQNQSQNNLKGYQAQANNRIASVNPAPVSQPSLVGAISGFGASAASSYNDYRKSLKKTKKGGKG